LLRGLARGPTWRGLFEATVAGVALPAFLGERGAMTPLEAPVAAVYKTLAGVLGLVRAHLPDHAPAVPPDAARLVALAESTGRLVADGEACAGPAAMIEEALRALLGPAAPHPGLDGALFEVASAAADQLLLADAAAALDRFFERELLVAYVAPDGPPPALLDLARQHLAVIASGKPVDPEPARAARLLDLVLRLGPARAAFNGPAAPAPELCALVGASLAAPVAAYARLRAAHVAAVLEREARITAAIGRPAPLVEASDRELFPRLHAHGWIEAMGRVVLTVDGAGASVSRGGAVVRIT
jgi:hypothetical protein